MIFSAATVGDRLLVRGWTAAWSRPWVRLLFVPLLFLTAGCGRAPNTPATAPVSGTVIYRGKPLETGTVTFYPDSGAQPASGQLGPGGAFRLMTFQANDGAVPGKHKVTVRAYSSSTDVSTGAPAELLAPRKYADTTTSPLTAMVQESGNTIELKLED